MDTRVYMTVIKVYEYSHLSINDVFTQRHFEQLVKYNERHGNKYFNVGNQRVYFKNYVGVLQIGNLTIEILPKADRVEDEETKNKWHNALIYMLHICGYLNIDSISQANLQIQRLTLIDLFYKVFIDEVKTIAHQGLIRKYRHNTDNRNFLKGRLIFSKHIAQNHLHKEKFYTSAQVYDHNNSFNQILLKALKILRSNCKNSLLYSEICDLLFYFENVADIKIDDHTFNGLQFTRNTAKYEKAITLARLIILNYSPDIKNGQNNVVGLLFDMNMLYEKVVYKLLKSSENKYKHYQLKLSSQHSKKFWNSRTIRPDILGEYTSTNNQEMKRFIIDTKWKRPYDGNPADDDLKQMFAYNVHFGAYLSVLLYPDCDRQIPKKDFYEESISIATGYKKHICSTHFIQMFDKDGKIKLDAGVELLNSLLEEKSKAVL